MKAHKCAKARRVDARRTVERAPITVRSNIALPPRVLPWERELLLPHVRALLDAVLQSDTADADDKEG